MYVRRQADREMQAGRGVAIAEAPGHFSWSGIWGGYLTFIGFGSLLLFFVLGIGFSSINPLNVNSWQSVGGGVAVWSVIVLLIAIFIGAWQAARGPKAPTRREGIKRSIVLWGLIMATTWMAFGWVASRAVNVAATAAGGAASAAAPLMQQAVPATVQSTLQRNGITITQAQATDISTRLTAGDRAGAATALSQAAGISTARANTLLGQITAPVTGGAQSAGRSAAQGAATGGSTVAWGAFWLSLIGLGAAILGGAVGSGGVAFRRGAQAPAPSAT
jgi:hypothetical protein